MKLRSRQLLPLMLLQFMLLPLLSCSDDPEGPASGRFLYYVRDDGGSQEFRRYVVDRNTDESVSADPVVWISEVAANGKVLFETRHGSTHQLWGRCETGQILSVPLPVSADPALEYIYSSPFQVSGQTDKATSALAYEGHHAGFLTWRRPAGSTDSAAWDLQACIFDCEAWSMQEIAISSFLRSYFLSKGTGFRLDGIVPVMLSISNDGSIIVLELIAVQKEQSGLLVRRHLLLGGSLNDMHVLTDQAYPAQNDDHALPTLDGATATLYATYANGAGMAFDCRGGSRVVSVPWLNTRQRSTLSGRSGEFVRITSPLTVPGHIEVVRGIDGSAVTVVESIETLQAFDTDLRFIYEDRVALSPDGEWLGFIGYIGSTNALFVLRRDGSEMRRVATGTFDVAPVVSDVVPY